MGQESIFKRYVDTLPKVYKPEFNPVISALLQALASVDGETETQIDNAKDQNFIRTATGANLDRLANSLGVSRPSTLGLTDPEFQELIPNLSLKPKQIRKAFYDTCDVFWGPFFSRANISTGNVAPYNVLAGDTLTLKVDGGSEQTVTVLASDFNTSGAVTIDEMKLILEKFNGVTIQTLEDSLTGDEYLNIRTNTPGSVGAIEVVGGTLTQSGKLNLEVKETSILDLAQRVSIYNFSPNELLIEIPAILPTLRRTLKGSHHFHEDSTLEPARGVEQGIWAGSFMFNPSGSNGSFTVTSQRATLQQQINKGQVYTSMLVDDTSLFESNTGLLVFGFGSDAEEVPVRFRGIANANTILIDPSYTFRNEHPIGTVVNVISKQTPYEPQVDGSDLAIYLTSPSGSRQVVQNILQTLKAAGIIINFVVLAPDYKYLLDNPYISEDDAPEA